MGYLDNKQEEEKNFWETSYEREDSLNDTYLEERKREVEANPSSFF